MCERIGEACAVEMQFELVLAGDARNSCDFVETIAGARFGGLGQADDGRLRL
jgi:hypothetical protein